MTAWLVLGWLNRFEATRTVASIVIGLLVFGYFLLAARRVYGGSWPALILKWLVVEAVKGAIAGAALTAVWMRALT